MTEGQKVGLSKKLLRAFLQKYIYFFYTVFLSYNRKPWHKKLSINFFDCRHNTLLRGRDALAVNITNNPHPEEVKQPSEKVHLISKSINLVSQGRKID